MSEFRPQCVLVTGGAGFIGSNFVRWLLAHDPPIRVVNLDLLTYAGNLESLEDVARHHGSGGDGRYYFVHILIVDNNTDYNPSHVLCVVCPLPPCVVGDC